MLSRTHRFRVALSFPGEHRPFVEEVAEGLAVELGRRQVLYDRFHRAEFSRANLDTYLQRLYHDRSELVVVFLCADYERKEWCGLEWRAVRDLLNKRREGSVMLLRLDDTEIPGLFSSTDGSAWIGDSEPGEAKELILERLRLNAGVSGAEPFGSPAPAASAGLAHLPYPSLGSLFRGRESDLETLHRSLGRAAIDPGAPAVATALHGLGGVGKTRHAVEYAWRHLEDHSALLFVPADTPESLHRNLAALAHPLVLNLPEHETTEEEVREVAVFRWLRDHPGWLLILDNLDTREAAEAAEALLPRLSGGRVVLTGRVNRWSPAVEPLEVGVLGEEDAAGFLLERTDARRRKTPRDEEHARTLAEELGCLALALEQAAAYVLHHRLSLPRYLKSWRTEQATALEWFDGQVMQYPRSVAVTWQTSFDQLGDAPRRLLERLAWLAPDPIPESLLETPVGDEGAGRTPRILRFLGSIVRPGGLRAFGSHGSEKAHEALAALSELETYSLVTRSAEEPAFTVHRLVQDVARHRQKRAKDDGEPPASLLDALGWLNTGFTGDPQDVRTWPILDPLAPHALAVAGHADRAGLSDPTARLMDQLGRLFLNKARHTEAEPLLRRALDIDEEALGPDHRNVATRLNNLAQLLQATNRLAEAEPLLRRALEIDENAFGPRHPEVAIDLNNLALLLQDTNRLAEAEPLLRQALEIDEDAFGPDHPNVARDLNNLAQLLLATNRLADAEPLMRRALEIDEEAFGGRHPNVARDLNNLAGLLQATNRLSEAEPLMRRALEIDEDAFGPRHPDVARDLNNLARLLQATHRLDEAEPLMRRDLEIFLDFTRRTGHEHPHLQAAFQNYRLLLQAMGKEESEIEATLESLRNRAAGPD